MKREIQIVELVKFEPVTLARLDGIPTPAHGNENLFVLFEIIFHRDIIWERENLFYLKPLFSKRFNRFTPIRIPLFPRKNCPTGRTNMHGMIITPIKSCAYTTFLQWQTGINAARSLLTRN